MSRVSGKSSKAKRKAKRTTGKLREHVYWVEPEEKVRPLTISTARLRRERKRAKAKRIRERKEPRETKKPPVIKKKLREIDIISRKGQPRVRYGVVPLERTSYLKAVSSSWLMTIGYLYPSKRGIFVTKTNKQYQILAFPFEMFEEWYYAHSKGTFWNEKIRDQYKIVGPV